MEKFKKKLKGKLLLFGKMVMPHAFWAPFSPVHREIEKMALSDIRRQNIILPRGLAKTTLIAQILPLYHIFLDDIDGPKCVVLVSKTQQHSKNCLRAIMNILEYSMEFRNMFGYHGQIVAKKYTDEFVILDNGSSIIAKGMGQPIRGVNIDSVRPSLLIVDDPEDENNTKTAEAMENNLLWFLKGALPALDVRHGKAIVIGTPIHALCVVERLAQSEGWVTIRRPHLRNENNEPDINGDPLWPEVWPKEKLLEEYRDLTNMGKSSVFYSERMCTIVGDEAQLIKPSYLRYYRGEYVRSNDVSYLRLYMRGDEVYETPKMLPVHIFIGVDPASSTKSGSDFSVIMPIAYDADGYRYALPYFRKRVPPMQLAKAIIEYSEMYHPEKMRIESVGYQEMLRDYIRTQKYIPGLEIKESPRNSKSSRLESLEPQFATGKVFVSETMQEFIDELLTYPRSQHDDTLDAYYYAQKGNYKPFVQEVKREEYPALKVKRALRKATSWLTS